MNADVETVEAPRAPIEACRWCLAAAPIFWAITVNRKRMPIEAYPDPGGNCEITWPENRNVPPLVTVHQSPPGMLDAWTPYMPHHARCKRDAPTKAKSYERRP